MVHDGRNAITLLFPDITCEQHELVTGRLSADIEPFVGALGHGTRREWAEVFAVLDPLIEDIAHIRPARIGKQRTVAERTGSELHASLEPGDALAGCDHLRSFTRGVIAAPGRQPGRLDR